MPRSRLLAVALVALLACLLATTASGQSASEDAEDDPLNCPQEETDQGTRTGFTNKALKFMFENTDKVVRPALLNRGTTIFAVLLILVLNGIHLVRGVDFPGLHTFLVHLVVLNVFYSQKSIAMLVSDIAHYQKCPFICSAVFLILDATLRGVVSQNAGAFQSKAATPRAKRKQTLKLASELKVVNRYMQVAAPISKAHLFFIGQFSLMMIFVYEVDRDEASKQACKVSFGKWFVASILTVIVGQSEVGSEYDPKFWEVLLEREEAQMDGRFFLCWRTKNLYMWKVRHAYSFIVNNIFRMLILGLAPIMLSVTPAFEFIKDVLALFFITKLDDVDGGSSLEQEIGELKAREKESYDLLAVDQDLEKTADVTPMLDTPPERPPSRGESLLQG